MNTVLDFIIPRLVKAIQDKRHQSYIDHSMQDLLTQRVLQMACGYQDANDSNHLRKDPMFKLAVGRSPLNAEPHLASAPTFTRLGKGLSRRDIYDLAYAFAEHFLSSYKKPPKLAVIDLDGLSGECIAYVLRLCRVCSALRNENHCIEGYRDAEGSAFNSDCQAVQNCR